MKPTTSLEQEREALLEQIHSSRAAYRRLLAQYDEPEHSAGSAAYGNDNRLAPRKVQVRGMPQEFPRSRSLQWVLSHPWAVAGTAAGLVALAALGPRRIKQGMSKMRRRKEPAPQAMQLVPWHGQGGREVVVPQKPSTAGAAMAGVMGLAAMALRDPQRLRTMVQAANNAWRWLQNRRQEKMKLDSRRQRDWNRKALPDR